MYYIKKGLWYDYVLIDDTGSIVCRDAGLEEGAECVRDVLEDCESPVQDRLDERGGLAAATSRGRHSLPRRLLQVPEPTQFEDSQRPQLAHQAGRVERARGSIGLRKIDNHW